MAEEHLHELFFEFRLKELLAGPFMDLLMLNFMLLNVDFNGFLLVLFNLLGHEVQAFSGGALDPTRVFLRYLNRLGA